MDITIIFIALFLIRTSIKTIKGHSLEADRSKTEARRQSLGYFSGPREGRGVGARAEGTDVEREGKRMDSRLGLIRCRVWEKVESRINTRFWVELDGCCHFWEGADGEGAPLAEASNPVVPEEAVPGTLLHFCAHCCAVWHAHSLSATQFSSFL